MAQKPEAAKIPTVPVPTIEAWHEIVKSSSYPPTRKLFKKLLARNGVNKYV